MSSLIEEEASHLVEHFRKMLRGEKKSDIVNNNRGEKTLNNGRMQNHDENNWKNIKNRNEKSNKECTTIDDIYVKAETYEDVVKASSTINGAIVQMQNAFGVPVLNTLWRMMAGKRSFFSYFVKGFLCLLELLLIDTYLLYHYQFNHGLILEDTNLR